MANRVFSQPTLPVGESYRGVHKHIENFRNDLDAKKKHKSRIKKWLDTEPFWKDRLGKGWKPQKFLGKGTYGIVGHWAYQGADRNQKLVKDVAVKQSYSKSLETEAFYLKLLAEAGTPHIIKMYGKLIRDSVFKTEDVAAGDVMRIYLEYCSRQDLDNVLLHFMKSGQPFSEYELWTVFHCLARAVLVMLQGDENVIGTRNSLLPNGEELVHFDLKPQNMLVGDPLKDREHMGRVPIKIADFGLARAVPSNQDSAFQRKCARLGTKSFLVPEQTPYLTSAPGKLRPWQGPGLSDTQVESPRYGAKTNIWGIGYTMLTLIHRPFGGYFDWRPGELMTYQSRSSVRLQTGGYTLGQKDSILKELNDVQPRLYSKKLLAVVAECLLCSPANRPSPEKLFRKTEDGLNAAIRASGSDPIQEGAQFEPYEEPVLEERFYVGQTHLNKARARAQAWAQARQDEKNAALERAAQDRAVQVEVEQEQARQRAVQEQAAQEQFKQERADQEGNDEDQLGSVISTEGNSQPQATAPRLATSPPQLPPMAFHLPTITCTVATANSLVPLGYRLNSYQLPELETSHSVLAVKGLLEIILLGGITKDKMVFRHGNQAVLMENHKALADYPGLFEEPYIKVWSSDFLP